MAPDGAGCMGAFEHEVVGAIARFVMPGEQKMDWIMTILLGIGGS
jgi:uncharacterized membrane protein YeaQ/YmgE (transglycosylase-associated protein family)